MTFAELHTLMTTGYMAQHWPYEWRNWFSYIYEQGDDTLRWWQINSIKGSIDHDDFAWLVNSMHILTQIDQDAVDYLMTFQPA